MVKPKWLFCDTEFTDLLQPELISVGIISEDGKHEFYMERNDYPKNESSAFVKTVVEPQLSTKGYSFSDMADELFIWLSHLPGEYRFIVDYYTDWELIIDLVDNLPANIISPVALLYAELDTASALRGMRNSTILETTVRARNAFNIGMMDYFYTYKLPQHHALNDAKSNRYGWLMAHESFYAKT